MKKNHKIVINCSKEHKDQLKREAEALGLSLNSYCLMKLLTNPKITLKYPK